MRRPRSAGSGSGAGRPPRRSVGLGLVARADYLARRGRPASLADLPRFDEIGFDRETPALRAFVARFPAFGPARFAFRSDSDLAQIAAIRAGFGIGVCQTGLAGDLVRLLPEDFAPSLPLWLVMHEDLRQPPLPGSRRSWPPKPSREEFKKV